MLPPTDRMSIIRRADDIRHSPAVYLMVNWKRIQHLTTKLCYSGFDTQFQNPHTGVIYDSATHRWKSRSRRDS